MTRHGFVERLMTHWRIVLTCVAALVTLGTYSFFTMPRQEFPAFTVRQGLVVGVMPGATSEQVEEKLTRPLEGYLFSFNEVDKSKTYSMSQDGRVIVMVELAEEVQGAAAPAFWAKLRHGLNELRSQKLPAQVVALVGDNDFGDTSALLFTITAEGHSPRDLKKQLEVLEDHLRRIPATSKLRRYGLQEEVLRVTIARERLSRYGIRPATVWLALQGLGAAPASARLDTSTLEMPVHVSETLRSEKELGETIVASEPTGAHVRLKDVATITREYGHDDAYVRYNGKTALVLSIEMQKGNDITHFGRQVDEALAAAKRELPPTVQIARVADQPQVVRTSVGHFMRDFGLAIACVVAVTMLLLPRRVASVAALTVPVTILTTLGILNVLGAELQTVSLAGLIVVLGMAVDDPIVVIDDHVERLGHGASPWTAAWKSAQGLTVPIVTATLAIIMAYAPMSWFMSGMGKDFIGTLPLAVGSALCVSIAIAVSFVPILNFWLIKKGLDRKEERQKPSVLDRMEAGYDYLLDKAFAHPWLTLSVGAGSVVVAALLALAVPQQLFPKVDRNQFAVEVSLPGGRPLTETDALVRQLEGLLLVDRRVTNVTSFIGSGSPRFHTLYAPNMPARNYAQLIVNTTTEQAALEILKEYSTRYRGAFPGGWVRWKQLDFGIAPAPIEVRLSGAELPALKALAARIEDQARKIPGATWVRSDYGQPVQSIEVVPDADACARLGVSPAALGLSLAVGSRDGLTVGTLWEGGDPLRIVLADDRRDTGSIEALRQQYVSSTSGAVAVPLEQLATIRPSWHDETIVRRNGVRTVTVRVDVAMGSLAVDVQRQLERSVGMLHLPKGLRVEYGGEKQAMGEQYGALTKSLLTSVAVIYMILLLQFHRHRKALLIMLTIPLSACGALVGLLVTGYPFGFTSFLGVISLMGLVVRGGIILVGYAEDLERHKGLNAREAALAAGKRRMRPVFLTSTAAAVGVIPMILSGSTLWGPLGAVTCFGLLFAMVLTLFVLPVAYWRIAEAPDGHPGVRTPAAATAATAGLLFLAIVVTPARAEEPPLTLAQALAFAARNNAEVRSADFALAAAQQTRQAARTKYFPQVSAVAVGVTSHSPLTEIATEGGLLPVLDGATPTRLRAYLPSSDMALAKHGYLAAVTATQPLFAGGRIVSGNRLAALGVDVARDNTVVARRDAIALAEEKYWRVIELTEKERTLRAYEGLLDSLERQATDAVQAGISTRNDLLKVSVKRQQAAVDRLRLESGLRLAARDLRRHIGWPEADSVVLADALAPPDDPESLGSARKGGVDRRPEIRQLERSVRAEELQTALKRAEMLPSVAVGAAAVRHDFSGLNRYSDVLAFGTVSVPISAIWEGAHTTAAGRAKQRAAETRLAEARKLIAIEMDKDWDDLIAAWRAAEVSEAAVEQAEVNLQEETDRYDNGLVTLSDRLEAEVLLHQAQDQRIETRREYWLKRAAYLRATGQEDLATNVASGKRAPAPAGAADEKQDE
jgi:multidrug efflux pump subunit AcrB/outer membrane protein TolC